MASAPSASIEWLSTKQASDRLGVTLRTLYRLIDDGQLPAYKIGRVIHVKAEELESYIEGARIKPGSLEHLYPDAVSHAD